MDNQSKFKLFQNHFLSHFGQMIGNVASVFIGMITLSVRIKMYIDFSSCYLMHRLVQCGAGPVCVEQLLAVCG